MSAHADPTFQAYSAAQAETYSQGRRAAYPPLLYSTMFEYHTEHGGEYNLLLDVGCGPGIATQDLAQSFVDTIGVDPGREMLQVARKKGYKTKAQHDVRFIQSGAEDIDKLEGVELGSVDFITSAMAAHWFDMSAFWTAAGRVLKPGGTVALWTCASLYCHPKTHNAKNIQALLFELERDLLKSYETPGNLISRGMYDKLQLPWDVEGGTPLPFPRSLYQKCEWDRDGVLSNGETFFGKDAEVMHGGDEITVDQLEKALSTSSIVTRYREANPEEAGTEQDTLKQVIKKIKAEMGDMKHIVVGRGTALLLLSKAQ